MLADEGALLRVMMDGDGGGALSPWTPGAALRLLVGRSAKYDGSLCCADTMGVLAEKRKGPLAIGVGVWVGVSLNLIHAPRPIAASLTFARVVEFWAGAALTGSPSVNLPDASSEASLAPEELKAGRGGS